MSVSFSESYKAAGVDITAGYAAVEQMRPHVKRTMVPGVLSGIGGFGGLFAPDLSGVEKPVLVSGTDGVGTKLRLAFLMDRHYTVGVDCVAMCVNDVVCAGAKPLFFLDYIAVGKNTPEKVASIVAGVAEGCVQAGCALIGGETAEMPGFYPPEEYDLAGFTVGLVDEKAIVDKEKVCPGDVIIALPSSGVHSNGFSLVRRVFDLEKELGGYASHLGRPLGEVLLEPTKIYGKAILSLLSQVEVPAISHIPGGGFYENIPRSLPEGCAAKIDGAALRIPPLFSLIEEVGKVPKRDMFNTFNMGVGMVAIVPKAQADVALAALAAAGEAAYLLGEVVPGSKEVLF